MEIRIIDGRRATDRAGAAELGGVSIKTINRNASPQHRAETGFPAPLPAQGRRDWYPIDGDDGLDAHFRRQQQRRAETNAQATQAPNGAPAWLYEGEPDDELPASEFYRAAGINQATFAGYVRRSKRAWAEQRDGYLPKPVNDEPGPVSTTTIYYFTRWAMIDWLNNRLGKGAGAGRKGHGRPGINDAVAVLTANPSTTPDELAAALDIEPDGARYLLRKARERLAAAAQ